MKLKTKLGGLVAILLAMILSVAAMGWSNANSSRQALNRVAEEGVPLTTLISEVTSFQLEQSIWLYRGLLANQFGAEAAIEEAAFEFGVFGTVIREKFTETTDLLTQTLDHASVEESAMFAERIEKFAELEENYIALLDSGIAMLQLIQQGKETQAELRLPMIEIDIEDMSLQLIDFSNQIANQTSVEVITAGKNADLASNKMLTFTLIAFFLSWILALLVIRSVYRQLGADPEELLKFAKALAAGDLTLEVDKFQGGVSKAIGQVVSKLRQVIRSIKLGADQVANASQQVLHGNTDLSSRTQQQASSLEQVAASMEEMAGTVNQNAENAQQAEKLATEARDKALAGSEVVSQAVTAMDKIDESSSRITDILDMIEEIAFHTNLLALNAAVEAARAGEQGRGFAVVANEVRSLAGRSSTAAKDIKALIKESINNVNKGMRLVNDSGASLQDIVTAVGSVSDIITEIAAASLEQSDGIAQVNKAVVQMEGMTQENAALVEQAAAASQSMGDEARDLKELVEFFQLQKTAEEPLTAEQLNKDDNGQENAKNQAGKAPKVQQTAPIAQGLDDADETSSSNEDDEWTRF